MSAFLFLSLFLEPWKRTADLIERLLITYGNKSEKGKGEKGLELLKEQKKREREREAEETRSDNSARNRVETFPSATPPHSQLARGRFARGFEHRRFIVRGLHNAHG